MAKKEGLTLKNVIWSLILIVAFIIGVTYEINDFFDEKDFDNYRLQFEYPTGWTPTNFTTENTSTSIQLYGKDSEIIFPVTIKTEVTKNNMYTSNDVESDILRQNVEQKYPEIAKNCQEQYVDGTGVTDLPIFKYKAQVDGKTKIRIFLLCGINFCMIEGKTLEDDYYLEDKLDEIAESLYVKGL